MISANNVYKSSIAADDAGKYWIIKNKDYFELWRKDKTNKQKVIIILAQSEEHAINIANDWMRHNINQSPL